MAEEIKASSEQKAVEAKKEKIAKPKLSSVYDLLEGAIKIWWKNLFKFIKVYLWGLSFALIPAVIGIILVFLLIKKAFFDWSILTQDLLLVLFVICFVLVAYFAIRAYIGIFLIVKNNYEGNELKIFKETKEYFWPYFWLTILTSILILLWTLLLIIPGIIYSVFYSFAVYAFFFEGLKGMKAIKRSFSLVKNYWWAVFGRFMVISIALYIFTMIISIPLHLVSDKNIFFYNTWITIIQITNFLIGPISMLYFYQIYKDLVLIKK